MRVILQDRFWVVHIPFVRMVKIQFIAQFPVDHLAHSVMPIHILILFYFTEFAYYLIGRFVSITT